MKERETDRIQEGNENERRIPESPEEKGCFYLCAQFLPQSDGRSSGEKISF